MEFDNHDSRIRYYQLLLELPELRGLEELPLPAGYRFVNYRPGDYRAWSEIEISAGEFETEAQAWEAWADYFLEEELLLENRMFFVETADREKVATASAWIDIDQLDEPDPDVSWLHWVAVKRSHQGRGLSKPLILRVLRCMAEYGYLRARVPTQTCTWLACKIYLDLGFRPMAGSVLKNRDGWRIARALTDHPALAEFEPAALEEILR